METLRQWCPWYDDALKVWTRRLGNDVDAQFAVACKLHDVDQSTMANYGPKWLQFVNFCTSKSLCPLPAEVDTVVRYVGWMAMRGTVRGSSMTQYLSCISKAHTHVDHSSPVERGGKLIADAVNGMKRLQHKVFREDEVLYLPAPYADKVLRAAQQQVSVVTFLDYDNLTPGCHATLQGFRDNVALVFNFADFGRADSQSKMRGNDIVVDSEGQVIFRLRKVKRRSGVLSSLCFQWPPGAIPGLLEVLVAFLWVRRQLRCSDDSAMWTLPFDKKSVAPSTTAKFDKLIKRAWTASAVQPEGGFTYSTRSLRAGAASASSMMDVPLTKIRRLGGWSPTSTTPERVYIDPTCPPTPAADRFFGWLRLPPPRHQG